MTTEFARDMSLFSYVCIDWYWRLLEPQEGELHWEDLDAVVNYWIERGKQINMRLWTTYDPGWAGEGGAPVAPDWLFDKAGCRYFEAKYPVGGEPAGAIRAPDYLDPIYLSRLQSFLTSARDHYEPNDALIMWHVGSYGPWGEWWVGHGEFEWPSDDVEHDTCVAMQNVYKELFGSKCQIALRGDNVAVGTGYETWKHKVAMDEAAANGWVLGVHGCVNGDAKRQRVLDEYWPSNVHYGEANWSYRDMITKGTNRRLEGNRDADLNANLAGAISRHYNWVHQYMTAQDHSKYPNRAYFKRGLKARGLGYRFVLIEAQYPEKLAAGSTFLLKQKWVNRNSGRAWRKYPFAIYLTDPSSGRVAAGPLVDEGFDQTMWVAGKTYDVTSEFIVPDDTPDGAYDLRAAMVDSSEVPRIQLAIEGDDGEKRHKIGTVRVEAP